MTNVQNSIRRGGGLLATCVAVAALYFARDILVPLALAILFAFLLEPLARLFEQIHLGRFASALASVLAALSVMGFLCYCVAGQFADFGNQMPRYEKTIHEKIRHVVANGNSFFRHAQNSIQDFRKGLTVTNTPASTNATLTMPATQRNPKVIPVEVQSADDSPLKMIRNLIGPSLDFMLTIFLVTLFCIFILCERDDLRERLIRIVGSRNAPLTNRLLTETGRRVSRYLLMQLIINVSYGACIALGLWAVGIPNPLLCGMLATMLRYVPYAGPWIAAAVPLAVGLAVDTGWTRPLLVLALYAAMEIVTSNFIEPWFYGSTTGITPLAVLLAAVFWTWLWGPLGLLLSVPLTVCLIAIARYVPQLELLDQLFGETESRPTPERPTVAAHPAGSRTRPLHFRRSS